MEQINTRLLLALKALILISLGLCRFGCQAGIRILNR